jgi:serine phosphatase RsbU (regulator of sigma subunit)
MMLAITIGCSAIVSWIVTLSVSSYETRRADEQISQAIVHYLHHLDERDRHLRLIVQVLLESQTPRSLLHEASANHDVGSKTDFTDEFLRREVPTELEGPFGQPAFQLIVNEAGEFVTAFSATTSGSVAFEAIKWPVDETLASVDRPVTTYARTSTGLAMVLGVPLRTEINQPPGDAYFVGYEMNDGWFKDQLLSDRRMTESTGAPLTAWFLVDGKVTARASSADYSDPRLGAFAAETLSNSTSRTGGKASTTEGDRVEFTVAGERYIGQVFELVASGAKGVKLVLASSRDQALAPLRRLQQQILLITALACLVAVIACRIIASMISRPIGELLAGTKRISAGRFDQPVEIHRRDELGELSDSFNQMADGLKERDKLREHRMKTERDMAVAREIQMDVLPKVLPRCPGYETAAFSLPAEETGGDTYDLVALAPDPEAPELPPSLLMILADATGHGIGPALSVTQVRAMLRLGVSLHAGLDDVLAQVNRRLCDDLAPGRFVTAFLGLLDTGCHRIEYHSAGQGPLLHYHGANSRFEWLDSSMLPLGVSEDPGSDGVKTIEMQPGDLLVLLTDGFYERANLKGKQFGTDRVLETIRQCPNGTPQAILDEIVSATGRFADGAPQNDDMTGIVIRRL